MQKVRSQSSKSQRSRIEAGVTLKLEVPSSELESRWFELEGWSTQAIAPFQILSTLYLT